MPWYVQVTLTAYPRALEPGAPPSAEVVAAMAALAERLGPRRVVWRYDPIIAAHGLGLAFHEANFAALAGRLAGRVERVVVSLLDEYRSTARRLKAAGHPDPVFASALKGREASPGLPPEPYPAILAAIGRLAALAGMEARACAEPWDLSGFGIGPGACIDAGLVSRISGTSPSAAKDRNQRPDCGCAASVDIGSYGACPTGCVYCYARR
jgi:DNA repair photolyase